jgi:hypothetical protein
LWEARHVDVGAPPRSGAAHFQKLVALPVPGAVTADAAVLATAASMLTCMALLPALVSLALVLGTLRIRPGTRSAHAELVDSRSVAPLSPN